MATNAMQDQAYSPYATHSGAGARAYPNTSTTFPVQVQSRADVMVNALGIIDQAVHTLYQLRHLDRMPRQQRSLVLDLISVYNQFNRNTRFASQLGVLASAGGCVMRLTKEWKHELSSDSKSHASASSVDSAYRYYKLASLAAASVLIPWLLLRRR